MLYLDLEDLKQSKSDRRRKERKKERRKSGSRGGWKSPTPFIKSLLGASVPPELPFYSKFERFVCGFCMFALLCLVLGIVALLYILPLKMLSLWWLIAIFSELCMVLFTITVMCIKKFCFSFSWFCSPAFHLLPLVQPNNQPTSDFVFCVLWSSSFFSLFGVEEIQLLKYFHGIRTRIIQLLVEWIILV